MQAEYYIEALPFSDFISFFLFFILQEEESDEESEEPTFKPPSMQPMPPPQAGGSVNIRKYDPKASKQAQQPVGGLSEKFLISPLTGEKIPVGSMESHMKIALLDPRWKEQKEKAIEEKRQQEQVFAEGMTIVSASF